MYLRRRTVEVNLVLIDNTLFLNEKLTVFSTHCK